MQVLTHDGVCHLSPFHLSFILTHDRYKRDQEIAYLATCSLYNVLYSSLLSESGPPLLDFEVSMHYQIFFSFYLSLPSWLNL